MPRRSAASLSLIGREGRGNRLEPPPTLEDPARQVFIDIVINTHPTHFQESDIHLLTAYCKALVMMDQAAEKVTAEPVTDAGKPTPWLSIYEKALRTITSLSLRLRLSPQARNRRAPKAGPRGSYYERREYADADADD